MKMKKIIAFLLVIVFSFGAVAIGLRIGFTDVFREKGPDAALVMSQDDYFTTRDFKSLFNVAYSLYAKGELTRANGLVDKMMYQEEWVLDDKTKANCIYLKGMIAKKKGRYPEAVSYFFRAKDLYQRLGLNANLYRVNLVTARVYLTLGDLEMVETILDESLTIAEQNDINLMSYYRLWSDIAFTNSDWKLALSFSEKAYEEAQITGDVSMVADSLSDMGFYHMLLGNFDDGYEFTVEAQRLILDIGDTDKYYYNLVNLVIFERCSGKAIPHSKISVTNSIQNRLREESDDEMGGLLEFVMTFDCDSINNDLRRKGESDPTPPD